MQFATLSPCSVQRTLRLANRLNCYATAHITNISTTPSAWGKRYQRIPEKPPPIPSTPTTSLVAQMVMDKPRAEQMSEVADYTEIESLLAATRLVGAPRSSRQTEAVDEVVFTGEEVEDIEGTPDVSVAPSDVPCAGCGAKLQCCDPSQSGYMTSEKFLSTPTNLLRDSICRRCTLIQQYNIALNVSVSPQQYESIVSQVRHTRSLVMIVVDVTDLPSSLFSRIPTIIGDNRPIYIVANKVDLLPQDHANWLEHIRASIEQLCEQTGLSTKHRVRHIALVSAKTKYGIEDLITKLLRDWEKQGDVYLLGCTNVGKSSLFNAFLSSDYCKSNARDFIHRATICNWPGTTLNLLKFPIFNPATWMLHKRTLRLQHDKSQVTPSKDASVAGAVGETFLGAQEEALQAQDYEGFNLSSYTFDENIGAIKPGVTGNQHIRTAWQHKVQALDDARFKESRWCYDSPGVVNAQQIINELSQAELSRVLSKRRFVPRSFAMKPTQTMFVSGLGRIDYTQGATTIIFTVFAAGGIPVHVLDADEVDSFYTENIGTKILGIPLGDVERLEKLAPLEGTEFTLSGVGWRRSTADVILSSIGWVAVTASRSMDITLTAYTPASLGCSLRVPALLPFAVNARGKRSRSSAAYRIRPNRPHHNIGDSNVTEHV